MAQRIKVGLLLFAAAAIPAATWLSWPHLPSWGEPPEPYSGGKVYAPSELEFERIRLGRESTGLPLITNVQILDFDDDGLTDVLACDASSHSVSLLRNTGNADWEERTLIRDVAAPAHVTCVDIEGDGDRDVIVSVLGNLMPDDGVIGRVELFERHEGAYKRHVILDEVRRVADVQPGDFDADGDVDLAVAVFGYARGSVFWLENRGGLSFREHKLLNAPGTIHVPVSDYDGDGDPDIAAIVSQDLEELWAFENLGGREFRKRRLWTTSNFDLGSAGLVSADLDRDGDDDLVLPAGDNLEDLDAYPQPYHGCYWFENQGGWQFEKHRISDLGGAYAADVGDMDGDADNDVVLVSMTNDWYVPGTASVVWLENDGRQNFTPRQIASEPIHLVTVAVGDINGDAAADIVAGALNFRKPYQRIGRVTGWLNQAGDAR